jgi:hypothetical protein
MKGISGREVGRFFQNPVCFEERFKLNRKKVDGDTHYKFQDTVGDLVSPDCAIAMKNFLKYFGVRKKDRLRLRMLGDGEKKLDAGFFVRVLSSRCVHEDIGVDEYRFQE